MEKTRNAYNTLVGKHERKKPLRRPRCRWEDNIRMYLREIGREVVDWIHLAQGRDQRGAVMNTVMNKGGEFID
jgi:ribosome biogenesis protein Nip4